MSRFRLTFLCCWMAVILALTGCAALLHKAAAPTHAPSPTPAPTATPVPETPNPLGAYFGAFTDACAPYQAQLATLANQDAAYVEKMLAVQGHIQHLQGLFLAPSQLYQDPNDNTQWGGLLFGALDGTGTISTIPGGYAFDCTPSDNSLGDINGSLKSGRLVGEWAQDSGEPRRGEIDTTGGGYFSLAEWDGAHTALAIENGVLYFGADVTASASSLAPEAWAGWTMRGGAITATASSATNSSLGGGQ